MNTKRVTMVTARLFLILPVLVLCVRCDNSTVKKRRGRPKKSGGEKVTTTMPTVPTPTQTTFDEYETYFDASGWWHEPRKQRPNATKKTRKRRKFETTLPTPTTSYDILAHYSPTKHVTGRLEAMYYSLKNHYNQPGRRREADHLVRDIIKKHDEKKGIKNEYTWVSIESNVQGDLKNSELRQYEDLKDISDL